MEGANAVPWQARYIAVSKTRLELLTILANKSPLPDLQKGGTRDSWKVCIETGKELVALQADKSNRLKLPGVTLQTLQDEVCLKIRNLPSMPNSVFETVWNATLGARGFSESGFRSLDINYKAVGDELVLTGKSIWLHEQLQHWIKAREAAGDPLPITEANELVPGHFFNQWQVRARALQTDNDVKLFLLEVKAVVTKWKKLIDIVDKGAKQVGVGH